MYSVSNDYLNKIKSSSREVSWYGTITLTSGTEIDFDTADIAQGGLSVSVDVSSEENPSIGNAFASELRLNLYTDIDRYALYGAEVVPYFRLYLTDSTYEDVPLGKFYVAEATRTSSMVSMVCYDAMTKLDSVKVIEDKGEATPYTWIKFVVERAGLTLGTTSAQIANMPNGNRTITFSQGNTTLNDMTCRDALGYLCAVLCANAYIGRDGSVYVKEYGMTAVETIGTSGRFSSSFADYTTEYTAVSLNISSTGATEYYADSPDDGLTFDLGANPWLQSGSTEGRETVCRAILGDLDDIAYVPFEVDIPVRPEFDIIDVLSFTGNQAASAIGAIVSMSYSSSGSMSIKCTGANPRLMGVKTKTEKAIENLNSTVAKEINQMSVVQNSSAVTCGENTETSILTYNFEVTQEENTTMVDVSVVMTSSASETEVGDVYTLSDIVAHLSFYVDGSEVSVYAPEFIVDEGKDTMTFNYSLSGLSVGAHQFDVRLTVDGGSGSVAVGDVHEMLWGYGITFEVYVKSLEIASLPTTTIFYVGQTLNYAGIEVEQVYNNGLRNNVTNVCTFDPVWGEEVTEGDVGTLTVSVDYDSFDASFDLTVYPMAYSIIEGDYIRRSTLSSNILPQIMTIGGTIYAIGFTSSGSRADVYVTSLVMGSDGRLSRGDVLRADLINGYSGQYWRCGCRVGDVIYLCFTNTFNSPYFSIISDYLATGQGGDISHRYYYVPDSTASVSYVELVDYRMYSMNGYIVFPKIKATVNGVNVTSMAWLDLNAIPHPLVYIGGADTVDDVISYNRIAQSEGNFGDGGSDNFNLYEMKYFYDLEDGTLKIYSASCSANGVTKEQIASVSTTFTIINSCRQILESNILVFGQAHTSNYTYGIYDVDNHSYREVVVPNDTSSMVELWQNLGMVLWDSRRNAFFFPRQQDSPDTDKYELLCSYDFETWTVADKLTTGEDILEVGNISNCGSRLIGSYRQQIEVSGTVSNSWDAITLNFTDSE